MNEQPEDGEQSERAVATSPTEDLFAEKGRIARLNRIRQLVFGSLDGLLVPLGVVSGVAGGTGNTKAVIVAGVAEAFAGALSMGAGEFISRRAEAQVQRTEIDKQRRAILRQSAHKVEEMVLLLQDEGMNEEDARRVAITLARATLLSQDDGGERAGPAERSADRPDS